MTADLVSDEQVAEWEALVEKLNVDEYNQAVPKNAWRAQPGPCRNWTVYQPIGPSGDYRVIAEELREPFATFIAAARTAVPLLVRALRDVSAQHEQARDRADAAERALAYQLPMLHSELVAVETERDSLRADLADSESARAALREERNRYFRIAERLRHRTADDALTSRFHAATTERDNETARAEAAEAERDALRSEVARIRGGREVEQGMLRAALPQLVEADSLRAENESLRLDLGAIRGLTIADRPLDWRLEQIGGIAKAALTSPEEGR